MSYFFICTSKSYLLSHQIENISLAVIIPSTHFISTGKKILFIKLNKNPLYVNFNKHKLIYVICIKQVSIKNKFNQKKENI